MDNTLTKLSQKKVSDIHFVPILIMPHHLVKMLDMMKNAFMIDIDITSIHAIPLALMQRLFIDFDTKFNHVIDSKFQQDVKNMDTGYTIDLTIGSDTVTINFLYNRDDIGYISAIIHAINTFCNMYPYSYHGLTINICLDDNVRQIPNGIDASNSNVFAQLQKMSGAFNVGGFTNRHDKIIVLTKKEEIIKLLYHELIHYVELDRAIACTDAPNTNIHADSNLAITCSKINLSEAYTEFVAVILTTAYQTLHLAGLYPTDIYQLYQSMLNAEYQYSIYLTSNILKFYNYNSNTYYNFFNGIGEKKHCPIYIWEYVLLRTQLLDNLSLVLDTLSSDFRLNNTNCQTIANYMKIDDKLIKKLSIYMDQPIDNHISYMYYDIDWNSV